jgi:thioesterase domain-containing protein
MKDWAEVRTGQKSLTEFFTNRGPVTRLRHQLGFSIGPTAAEYENDFERLAAAGYADQLLEYVNALAQRYEPKPFPGKLTVFKSDSEPTGWFLSPKLAWAGLAHDGVDVITIHGDHRTIFDDPGAGEMAAHIAAVLNDVSPDCADPETSVS